MMNALKTKLFYFRYARYYLPTLTAVVGGGAAGGGNFTDLFYHAVLPADLIFGLGIALGTLLVCMSYMNYVINRQGWQMANLKKNKIFDKFLDLYYWGNCIGWAALALLAGYLVGDAAQRAVIVDLTLVGINIGCVYWLWLIYQLGPIGWKIMSNGRIDQT